MNRKVPNSPERLARIERHRQRIAYNFARLVGCTNKQARRYALSVTGITTVAGGQLEGVHRRAFWYSVQSVKKKIRKWRVFGEKVELTPCERRRWERWEQGLSFRIQGRMEGVTYAAIRQSIRQACKKINEYRERDSILE